MESPELHASVAYQNEPDVKEANPNLISSSVFVVIKGISAELIKATEKEIEKLEGMRSLSCVVGVCTALREGAQVNLPEGQFSQVRPIETFRRILMDGMTNRDGTGLRLEVYKTSPEPVEKIFQDLKTQDYKLQALYPFAWAAGVIGQKILGLKSLLF